MTNTIENNSNIIVNEDVKIPENKIKVNQIGFVSSFKCDTNFCHQDCCSKYGSIQVDRATVDLYTNQTPELLQKITKKDDNYFLILDGTKCLNFKDGKCAIQSQYGARFLCDTCSTYPRQFKKIGEEIFVTASFPCSEMIKAALFSEHPFVWQEAYIDRTPFIKDVSALFEGASNHSLINVLNAVIKIIDDDRYNSEQVLLKLLCISCLFDDVKKSDFPNAINTLFRITSRVNLADIYGKFDRGNTSVLDEYLYSQLAITKFLRRDGFTQTINSIMQYLENNDHKRIRDFWEYKVSKSYVDKILKNYIKAKIYENLFPIANWNNCLDDMMFIISNYIGIRLYFVTKLLMSGNDLTQEDIISTITIFECCLYNQGKRAFEKFKNLNFNFDKLSHLLIT